MNTRKSTLFTCIFSQCNGCAFAGCVRFIMYTLNDSPMHDDVSASMVILATVHRHRSWCLTHLYHYRQPTHREVSSHAAIITRRVVASLIHNHPLSGHMVHHNNARWVGRLPGVVFVLQPPSNVADCTRGR